MAVTPERVFSENNRYINGCLKAVFQLRVFQTYVHARKIVNASNFLTFNI